MNVLLVDDDRSLCEWVETALGKKGIGVTWRTSADEGLALLDAEDFSVVVADLNLRGMNGLELCERIVGSRPNTPVIVITAFGSLETAVLAIRAGAYDFIAKPFEMEELRLTLERAMSHRALRQELTRLRRAVDQEQRFGDLLGTSNAMRKVYDLIDRISETDVAVLITGESGTGKELVARAIHSRSRRAPGPFVALNCSAMPETLLETELFGHVKGAFTDARTSRSGLFLQAQSGTLFLDEVGELPLPLQPKLLRALQERRVRPVGSDTEIAYDARLVAATNRDLELAVEEHRFREDLFYRINVLHVHLPPLRERGSDILLLAQHFITRCAETLGKPVTGLTPEAAERLLVYGWPGNVRELSNCVERAVALTRFDRIVVDDLPEKVRAFRPSRVLLGGEDPAEVLPLEEVERRYILWAVETIGNRTLAAQRLGLDRKTLYRKLARYDHPKKRDADGGAKG
jgi:two-component system response regulator HydG